MKYFSLILINSLVILGLITLIFSQKEYLRNSQENKKELKSFQVKLKNKVEEKKKISTPKPLEVKSKAKPIVTSLLSQSTQILGKSFDGSTGAGVQMNSSGALFSEKITEQSASKEEAAQIVNFIQPKYPEYARSKNLEGYIKISLQISDSGKLQSYNVIEAEPKGVFEEALKEALAQWSFKPAVSKGKSISSSLVKKIQFKLDQL